MALLWLYPRSRSKITGGRVFALFAAIRNPELIILNVRHLMLVNVIGIQIHLMLCRCSSLFPSPSLLPIRNSPEGINTIPSGSSSDALRDKHQSFHSEYHHFSAHFFKSGISSVPFFNVPRQPLAHSFSVNAFTLSAFRFPPEISSGTGSSV